MLTRRFAGLLALALALVFVPGATADRASFPVTVEAANGAVQLAQKPVRIVSLSPTATEDLFAIGAGPQVIAVDDDSNYPSKAPKTKLSGYTPNAEAVANYRPDLVVASNDANGILKALGKLHIPVLLEPAASNLSAAYAQIEQLGAATGHTMAASALAARLRREVDTTVASLPRAAKRLTVYHELEPDYYSVTSKTFLGQIYTLLGLHDIADAADKSGSGYPKLSAEYIVASNPDLIVLADSICCGQSLATVAKRPGWQGIAAVRHGDVLAVSDDIASRWGPRIIDFIRDVAMKVRAAANR